MYALLVKPAVWKKRNSAKFIREWQSQGAIVLQGDNAESIRNEVQEILEKTDNVTVVACGGDGTVHLLLNATVELPVKFAVFPMGTGNDFARHLGITNLEQARSAVFNGRLQTIDIGHIQLDDEVRYFAGIASCGFDAQVNERANRYRGPQGTAKYVAALLGELKDLSPIEVTIEHNNEVADREITLLALGNTSSYGGGMKVCPHAKCDDALFDVMSVGPVSRMTLLRVFPRVFRGTHITHPAVTMDQTSSLTLSGGSFSIYADGERVGVGPAVISVQPQRLSVWRPRV